LLKELRKRLAAAHETAKALAREPAWPMSRPMPKVLENVEGQRPASPSAEDPARLPATGEIIDFLGRAIQSADAAIKKLATSGPQPKVLGVLGAGLADAGVPDARAVDALVAMNLEENDSRSKSVERQRKRGTNKR
jgi:hypothetical protein